MHASSLALNFVAADGYRLAGQRFAAQAPLRGRLVVAGATAVPQGFYRRFAEFASAQGFETVTFDYRGMGQSRPPRLRGFRMDMLDWGRQDLAAVVDALAVDDVPLYLVGHSFGGHALGLLPNHHKLAGCYLFGLGAGWHGYMPRGERLRVLTMWRVVLPLLTWSKGYCPWRMLGLGEDLPRDVFHQWRRWCQFPHFFFDDPQLPDLAQRYAQVRTPIVAANALDDLWALPASRDAFVRGYSGAPLQRKEIDPRLLGTQVGHMGYFRPQAQACWQEALGWFGSLAAPA
ncbi:alpha/beta fold hydrolase [Acidovorax sp. HDW3]|uniref:alpha/beta hydrolase family protein n=1 Tax=Acidovorax sp. HDW3 TaxID=2714923 RepID=UPI00140ADC5E|nr:alpha/beta fold hydrolase [Acidovorax sp. HDW3]QIL44431.1 alpha/beta fold hydrolase [Acidovorax sp. HDW3]